MSSFIPLRATTHTRVSLPEKLAVHLTEQEDHICSLLDECTHWIKEHKGSTTSCRIAGGWVRDKLLGEPSNDIDIALENMMGVPFAEHFVTFCSSVKGIHVDKIAKIESNPDRSKHLETARTTILGMELDFVNLRNEEYAENSRIPTQVTFGTPREDAMRRDITINALFYNVHSRSVEDCTGQGLTDLQEGIIRTPLSSRETFMDDPLRVLRCIRFASRFGFDLSPDLRSASLDTDIQEALGSKISRERVGEEMHKMLNGRDPLRAIRLIDDLSLFGSIFHIPPSIAPELSSPPAPSHLALAAASILNMLLQSSGKALPPLHPQLLEATSSSATRSRLYLACALYPYYGITYVDSKRKIQPAVQAAIRESVRLGTQNHYLDGVPLLFSAIELLKGPRVDPDGPSAKERVRIGLLLREKSIHNPITGSHWAVSTVFSLVSEMIPLWDSTHDKFNVEEASHHIERYNSFVARIVELNLPSQVDARTILDGRDVVRILNAPKPGQWMARVLASIIEWQLENPDGTKEDCEEWLHNENVSGKIKIEEAQSKRGKEGTQGQPKKKAKTGENGSSFT